MRTRRVILISLIVAVIAICAAWAVYKILPHSVNVTLTGIKYKLGSDGAKVDAEQETVVIRGKLYTTLKGHRTFKGEINIVGEQIPVPPDQRNLEISFFSEGFGVMVYPYFYFDQRGATKGSNSYVSHLLFINKDFSQVAFLLNVANEQNSTNKSEGDFQQTVNWDSENGYIIAAPASTREEALALSNKLMRKYQHEE